MRKVYFILVGFISVLSFHCQKEPSYVNVARNGNAFLTATTLQGNIIDENGQPAFGVTIKTGDKSATTDARGYFRMVNMSFDKKNCLVTAEKAGYFKAYRSFIATTGVNQVMIRLIKKELSGRINSASGGDVALLNGSKISLPANGIIKSSGESYTGTVNVYAAYIDPSSRNISQTVPGSFTAIDKNHEKVVLTSYGMLAVELESMTGEKLQIAPGNSADLTIPIPPSLLSSAPSSISLWYINEQTGIWQEEGSAKRNGNNYVGEVKHFSFWNCDIAASGVTVSMTLKTFSGSPLVYTEVQLTDADGYQSLGWTDSLGQVAGFVPANKNLFMEVLTYSSCNGTIYSKNLGSFSKSSDLGIITVNNIQAISSLHGRLVSCTNTPVTDGYAIIYCNNILTYAPVNSDGNFTADLVVCPAVPMNCEILPVDNKSKQQGVLIDVNVAARQTDAGNISACGMFSEQYINYTLDGKDYSLKSDANDTLIGYTSPWPGSFRATIMGFNNTADYIYFESVHDNSAGTFPIIRFATQNFRDSSIVVLQPSTVTLTNNPQTPGEFYEGSLAAKFTDQQITGSAIHSVSGSFRVRRLQ